MVLMSSVSCYVKVVLLHQTICDDFLDSQGSYFDVEDTIAVQYAAVGPDKQ